MSETFTKKIQLKMGKAMKYTGRTGGKWRGHSYDHICLTLKDNFIDGVVPKKCNVKGPDNFIKGPDDFIKDPDNFDVKYLGNIKYHQGAAHLNSSQVMCISFFKKFFETEVGEDILLSILRKSGVNIPSDKINNAIFEYEPDPDERTNFDFFMVMEDKQRISVEVKYTESGFGGISPCKDDPDRYNRKWNKPYDKMVKDSPYLKCGKNEFYENYQINRNIVYANAGDAVIFLTPKANNTSKLSSGRDYIDKIHDQHPEVLNLYWEDLFSELMQQAKSAGPDFEAYYKKFGKKYIDVL